MKRLKQFLIEKLKGKKLSGNLILYKGFIPMYAELTNRYDIEYLEGDFYCSGISSLIELPTKLPKKVSGKFFINDNALNTLIGSPDWVGKNFNCNSNNLKSLEGAPKEVGGNFVCFTNWLKSLEGAPEKVGGNFVCSFNNLTSLEGAPKEVGGNFDCSDNPIKFTIEDVRKVCNVKGEIYV